MNRLWGVAFVLLVGAGAAAGAGAGARAVLAVDRAPEEKTGLKVGEKAPEFRLKDQFGKERSLTALLKDGNVALVFFRSAGW